jgi:hypothetical protein
MHKRSWRIKDEALAKINRAKKIKKSELLVTFRIEITDIWKLLRTIQIRETKSDWRRL